VNALLIRHGDTAAVNRMLAGRVPGIHLNESGRAQAARLPARLTGYRIRAIYTSGMERAQETAAPLGESLGVEPVLQDALAEVDFGAWAGQSFADLDLLPEWRAFNAHRCTARAPGGERLADVQARVVMLLEALRDQHGGETIALVSHAEVIRCAVLHYLTVSLDLFQRIEISPASITVLELHENGPRFLTINHPDPG
jgi:probable phosphoglycerate mutase